MNPEHLREVDSVFNDALDQPVDTRDAWLQQACSGRPDLLAAVEDLLAAHAAAVPYFEEFAESVDRGRLLEIELAARGERRIGPYKLVKPIGQGGMGTVFLAERVDGGFDQQVALKLLAVGIDGDAALRRFRTERQIGARLAHPGIARLLDGGVSEDHRPYFVMELVDGAPIVEWCATHQATIAERLRLMLQVTDAVQYAHSNLVVHRDLKPSNILVTGKGEVKLLDFGIARLLDDSGDLTRTLDRALTPAYASPEQVRGERVTTAADVFSLGVVLYELLSGTHPFRDAGIADITTAIVEHEPQKPSAVAPERVARQLRGDLDTICMMALRKDPARRYRSVEQLAADIRNFLGGMPVTARPDTRSYRMRKFVARHRVAVGATTASAVLLLAFTIVLAIQARRIADERDKAAQIAGLLADLFEVSDPSEARGATLTAREVLDRGTARVEASLAAQPDLQVALFDVLARVYQNLGLYQKASSIVLQSLGTRRRLGLGETPDAAASLARLGELERQRGDYPASEQTLRDALALLSRVSPDDRRAFAVTSNHLGKVLVSRGKLDEARQVVQDAVLYARRSVPVAEAEVAEGANTLGVIAFSRGDFPDAEARFREALDLRRRVLGPDHPQVPAALNNLASLLSRKGDAPAAEALYQEALGIYRRILDAGDPRIATTLNNLGLSMMRRGDAAGAEPLLRESLAIRRKSLPARHPDVAQSLANLGFLLQEQKKLDEAAPLAEEALEIRNAALGPAHPLVAQSLHNLGLLRRAQGNAREGERLLREALAIQEKALPANHPDLAATRKALAPQ